MKCSFHFTFHNKQSISFCIHFYYDLLTAGLTKCQRERQLTLGWSGQARQDAFVPDCSSDGNYENVQCHEASGFCWCVDGNGNEIVGTRQRGRPVCTKQGM